MLLFLSFTLFYSVHMVYTCSIKDYKPSVNYAIMLHKDKYNALYFVPFFHLELRWEEGCNVAPLLCRTSLLIITYLTYLVTCEKMFKK